MNKLAAITGFLGSIGNRYMQYQGERSLEEKFEVADRIDGLDGLELCYPADFDDPAALRGLLEESGLGVSAVNFRSRRTGRWLRGSFTSSDPAERREVQEDFRRAVDLARELGCRRLTTCPLNEGHDYPFELDYAEAYDAAEQTLRRVCEHDPDTRICIEYKPSDPRVRTLVASAAEALALCRSVELPNLGVTLDFGHSLLAGERPAQAACLLAREERLFYVHLNDNDRRWDWDMVPGAYHLWEFVEFFHYLRQVGYREDWYSFDVFPKESDTAETFQRAFEWTRRLEALADELDPARVKQLQHERDPAAVMAYLQSLL